jgi:ADP-ribosylglycohydrolase
VGQYDNFSSSVLAAVNLGGDTDTTGAVTGGLAGVLYGHQATPDQWLAGLARREQVIGLAEKLAGVILRGLKA